LQVDPRAEGNLSKILQGTLDAISDGIQIIDADWRYVYLNATACRHGRRDRDELVGRSMMECYPGIERTPMFGVLTACMNDRTARVLDNEFLLRGRDARAVRAARRAVPAGHLRSVGRHHGASAPRG